MDSRTSRILFTPIMVVLGILPLIVRLKIEILSGRSVEVFGRMEYVDFYSQSKAIVIIGISLLIFIIMFYLHNNEYIKRDIVITTYVFGAALFLVFSILSALLSNYKDIAMWGVYDRAEGLVVQVCYIILMFYTIYAFNHVEQYKYIIGSLSIVVIVSTIIGITQYNGKDILLTPFMKHIIVPGELAHIREMMISQFDSKMITGTMYNPNYVGSFAAMMVPIFSLLAIFNQNNKKRVFFILLALCSLFLLFGSASSAGIVAFGMILLTALVIFSKKIGQVIKNRKKIFFAVFMLLITLTAATNKLWYDEVRWLMIEAINMITPKDQTFDYRDHIPIRNIVTQDGKTILYTQDDSINITYKENVFVFYDDENNKIDYAIDNNYYMTKDERFSRFYFEIFYVEGNKDLMAGLALLDLEQPDTIDGLSPLIFLKGTADEAVYIMNPFTQERADTQYPEAIGFEGKERVGSGRGYIWSRTLPLLKRSMLIGYGPDAFAFEFPQRDYLGKYYTYNQTNITVDKPHSLYLQIAVNNGVAALIGFLILILTYIIDSLKLYAFRSSYEDQDKIGVAALLAIVGYLTAGVFNDSNVSVAPIFWVLLGVGIAVNYLIKHPVNQEEDESLGEYCYEERIT